MKSFSESHKADKALVTGKATATPPAAKEALSPTEPSSEDKGKGGITPPKGSPRNMDLLKKLVTRERGNKSADKKPAGKK